MKKKLLLIVAVVAVLFVFSIPFLYVVNREKASNVVKDKQFYANLYIAKTNTFMKTGEGISTCRTLKGVVITEPSLVPGSNIRIGKVQFDNGICDTLLMDTGIAVGDKITVSFYSTIRSDNLNRNIAIAVKDE